MPNKHRYISRAGWYSIEYPEGWVVEEGRDLVTLYRPQGGVGALQISAYQTPEPQDCRSVLLDYLDDQKVSIGKKAVMVQQDRIKSVSTHGYEEDDSYHQVWVVTQTEYLLFVTYNCRSALRDTETIDVHEMVQSIKF